jgi:hypothetical protein
MSLRCGKCQMGIADHGYVRLIGFPVVGREVICYLCFACYFEVKPDLEKLGAEMVESGFPPQEEEQP